MSYHVMSGQILSFHAMSCQFMLLGSVKPCHSFQVKDSRPTLMPKIFFHFTFILHIMFISFYIYVSHSPITIILFHIYVAYYWSSFQPCTHSFAFVGEPITMIVEYWAMMNRRYRATHDLAIGRFACFHHWKLSVLPKHVFYRFNLCPFHWDNKKKTRRHTDNTRRLMK